MWDPLTDYLNHEMHRFTRCVYFGFVVFRLNLHQPKSNCEYHDLRINKFKLEIKLFWLDLFGKARHIELFWFCTAINVIAVFSSWHEMHWFAYTWVFFFMSIHDEIFAIVLILWLGWVNIFIYTRHHECEPNFLAKHQIHNVRGVPDGK